MLKLQKNEHKNEDMEHDSDRHTKNFELWFNFVIIGEQYDICKKIVNNNFSSTIALVVSRDI